MTSTERKPANDPGKRALALVRKLVSPDSDVYELFAQLDALPPDAVLAALASTTGPSRPPEELDDDVRRVHGFPAPALQLTCTRVVTPAAGARLGQTTAEQIERACTTWDGLALPLAARLAEDGAHSLSGKIEHRTLDDLDGMPQFDVVLLDGDSGAIFRAGTTDVFGTISYGKVEVRNRRERTALQQALSPAAAPAEPAPRPRTKPAAATTAEKKAPAAKKKAPAAMAKKAPAAPAKKAPAAKKPAPAALAKKAPAAKKKAPPPAKKAPAAKKSATPKPAGKIKATTKTAPARSVKKGTKKKPG